MPVVQRISLEAKCNTPSKQVRDNVAANFGRYPTVEWGAAKYPPCAVVGGGPSAKANIEVLKNWGGDIYAVNDTAKFLSDNGVSSYLYAIDCSEVPYKHGILTKGAVFATRVHPVQFIPFRDVRVFEMCEENQREGIEGGPTAVARAPHLFLRMGYMGVVFFGCDGAFSGPTHVSGTQEVAYENMIIVNAGGIDYLTNASLMIQSEYLVARMQKFPRFLINASGGLLKAMLENPETWSVVAIAKDLKDNYEQHGCNAWTKKHDTTGRKVWQPQAN